MNDAPLDPPDLTDAPIDSDGGAFFGTSRDVAPVLGSGLAVEGCDLELSAEQHRDGTAAVAQCSCYWTNLATRRAARKVA